MANTDCVGETRVGQGQTFRVLSYSYLARFLQDNIENCDDIRGFSVSLSVYEEIFYRYE